jgi:predicted DNA-binding protein YlxM (UPF0122 family)
MGVPRKRVFSKKECTSLRIGYERYQKTVAQLAEDHGASVEATRKAIERAGGKVGHSSPSKFRFTDSVCEEIRFAYEHRDHKLGKTIGALAREYRCDHRTIKAAILRVGGVIRTKAEVAQILTLDGCEAVLKAYQTRKSVETIAREMGISRKAVNTAITRAGGKLRTNGEARRVYRTNTQRERRLFTAYRLTLDDVRHLHSEQKGRCLWCNAKLPADALDCIVDHRGRKNGLRNRKNVRGLCCPDGLCNLLAGHIEGGVNKVEDWGVLASAVKRIKRVLQTNRGNLKFANPTREPFKNHTRH